MLTSLCTNVYLPVSRFLAHSGSNLNFDKGTPCWLTHANLKSFSAAPGGGLTKVQRCLHNGKAPPNDASTKYIALDLTIFDKRILDLC